MANLDAVGRDGRNIIANTYQNNSPKGRNERTPRSGAIAIFVILTPLGRGSETA